MNQSCSRAWAHATSVAQTLPIGLAVAANGMVYFGARWSCV